MKHILQCCIWACFCLVLAQTSKAQVGSVNHSSGTMGVNIPLYTLTEGSLSVPISLSYDGSGVSVDAIASEVGVNWRLNAGGYISRAVRGLPDENIQSAKAVGVLIQGYLHTGYPSLRCWCFHQQTGVKITIKY